MAYPRALIPLLVLLSLSFASSATAAMRCGSKLVRIGDTKVEVLARCGEPLARDYIGEDTFIGSGDAVLQERTVEEWTYNFGSRKFMQILRFRGNRLIDIRSGDRGF